MYIYIYMNVCMHRCVSVGEGVRLQRTTGLAIGPFGELLGIPGTSWGSLGGEGPLKGAPINP